MAGDDGGSTGPGSRGSRGAHAAPRSALSGVLSGAVVLLVLIGIVLLATRCGGGSAAAPAGPAGATAGSVATAAPLPAHEPTADEAARARLRSAVEGVPVLFDGNGTALRPGADAALGRIAAAARDAPGVTLLVTGHTAPVDGDAAWCQRLSQLRADLVAARLRDAGVAPDRLRTVGVSHMYPAATWAASRRVEVAPA